MQYVTLKNTNFLETHISNPLHSFDVKNGELKTVSFLGRLFSSKRQRQEKVLQEVETILKDVIAKLKNGEKIYVVQTQLGQILDHPPLFPICDLAAKIRKHSEFKKHSAILALTDQIFVFRQFYPLSRWQKEGLDEKALIWNSDKQTYE